MLISEDVRKAVLRQVEHYLSEQNLSGDAFLRGKMDPNGTVPLSLIAGFPRLKSLCPSPDDLQGSTWEEAVVDMIKDSVAVKVSSEDGVLRLGPASGGATALRPQKAKSLEIVVSGGARDSSKSVFVASLANEVTESLLYELFVQIGPVERVTLPLNDADPPTHKGFGFVQFADGEVNAASHSVNYAIRVMNNQMLCNRTITVKSSTSSVTNGEGRGAQSRVFPGDMVDA
mmetsp:Transcript_51960/g.123775  ORF Transcript_51960/g.123775 Transcript_51960/m.123775 type:complete len:230 (-) Transcript_51960:99-788(-)|eukprot:CAMPEP_0180154888 /NCGR_PEP_ID=MMETSP0986-20121125/24459_1 /TAXON_ID=697907 /ORGANISM="non described non described, Strain CCMP2293" /LENGTH=229 /DNA_ID=CAMNT_0022103393 /DNA_START=259 /DNA_END=948 /DNA_ORIENTATION=-